MRKPHLQIHNLNFLTDSECQSFGKISRGKGKLDLQMPDSEWILHFTSSLAVACFAEAKRFVFCVLESEMGKLDSEGLSLRGAAAAVAWQSTGLDFIFFCIISPPLRLALQKVGG